MRGSPNDCSPAFQKGAQFVKYGDFTRTMLLWWVPKFGYFVTQPNGMSLNGETRLNQKFVEQSIAGK